MQETDYNGSCLGLVRYCGNYVKQWQWSSIAIGYGMAIIEVVEFLATYQLKVLVAAPDWDVIVNVTLYSYGLMILIKFGVWLWFCYTQWDSQVQTPLTKFAQFFSLFLFTNFLPYGEFLVFHGYKMFTRPEQPGITEAFPAEYAFRRSEHRLKSYTSTIGGHYLLMLCGFTTLCVNEILFATVFWYFTPAVFPQVDPALAQTTQGTYVFYYCVVWVHCIACTVLALSMLVKSCRQPFQDVTSGEEGDTINLVKKDEGMQVYVVKKD